MSFIMKEWCEKNDVPLTEDQVAAGEFLESRGQRFLVEFGYENAVEKADMLFIEEALVLAMEPESQMVH